ncbi:GATA transcription factor [Heracleum sosnowskyi]|uniref:GATA transcription factor n=1 Tax=Heracleum sosnowskyi TaxID=360622 RepID=A0AAD8I724_9APIA|nr:GATA transcription factor [Heracleum sosnowskyi]
MVDLSDKGSDCEEMMVSEAPEASNQLKTCVDCGTSKTPLWRGGPAGPKTLCNACGIRSRKRRRALLGLNNDDKKPKKVAAIDTNTPNNDDTMVDSLKRKLVALGSEVVIQRPRSSISKPRRKISEEEQAAMLLMALSYGSVFA